jgi:hypothetical protein
MLRITGAKGFQMTFDNGWTVSVQFGYGNYCANRMLNDIATYEGKPLTFDIKCENAEVARWHKDDTVAMAEPDGWQTPDQVAAFIAATAALSADARTDNPDESE